MFVASTRLGQRALAPAAFTLGVALYGERFSAQTSSRMVQQSAQKAYCRLLSSSTKQSLSFMQWYEKELLERPIYTKMRTGGFLWGAGDAVAQIVPPTMAGHSLESYDWLRTGRAFVYGCAIHAPLSHFHFNFLEWMTVKAGLTGLSIPVFKTIMEQFVYWSWFSNALYHYAMGALQGQSMDQCYHRVVDNIWETQKAQWVFWIPVQLLNFQFVPVRHQLNVVLLTSIVWTALLSMWYPPETTPETKEMALEAASHD